MLSETVIKKLIDSKMTINVMQSVGSTNAALKQLAANTPHACITDQQTAGRGQRNKTWHSPAGVNLYMSLSLPFVRPMHQLKGLSLAVGVMVAQALKPAILPHQFQLKWPNDIFIAGQKCAGILIETQRINDGLQVIIGLGLNVNMQQSDPTITQPWTSLKEATGKLFDRNQLAAQLLNALHHGFERFTQQGFSAFTHQWNALNWHRNKTVSFKHHQQSVSGLMVGVNEQGELLIQDKSGSITVYSSAEQLRLT